MAYNSNNLMCSRGTVNAEAIPTSICIHTYTSTDDDLSVVITDGYFSADFGFDADDILVDDYILIHAADTDALYVVTAIGATPTIGVPTIQIGSLGLGDVTGPASSTDHALTRFNGTTGKLLENSGTLLDDSGNLTLVGNLLMPTTGGTAAALNYYEEYLDAAYAFVGPTASSVTSSLTIKRVGKVITLQLSGVTAAYDSASAFLASVNLATRFRPANNILIPFSVINNGTGAVGTISIATTGAVVIWNGVSGGSFTAGTIGWYGCSATYTIA